LPVPSVASEAAPPTFKHATPLPPQPQRPQAGGGAPSPFESLLDTAEPPAPPPAADTARGQAAPGPKGGRAAEAQPSDPPADRADCKPGSGADDGAQNLKTGKNGKAVAARPADVPATQDGETKSDDAATGPDAKADAQADTQADAQSAPLDATAMAFAAKPAAAAAGAATVPTGSTPADATEAKPDGGAAAPTHPAAANVASSATAFVGVGKAGPQTDAGKVDASGAPESVGVETAETDSSGNGDAGKTKGLAPAHADGRPADIDKPESASARGEGDRGKIDGQSGKAPAATASAKPADAAPPVNASAPGATQAAAPTAQPQQHASPPAVPQAVPLAGVGIEIASRALAGKNRFEIRLDPPELGRIEVRIEVSRDGRVTSHLTADRPDTLSLLQRDAAGLERALQDAGLKTSDNSLQFSLRDQSAGRQQDGTDAGARAPVVDDDAAPIEALPSSYIRLAGFGNGLDIRV
jgi:flagellar hook-length control protein FliK